VRSDGKGIEGSGRAWEERRKEEQEGREGKPPFPSENHGYASWLRNWTCASLARFLLFYFILFYFGAKCQNICTIFVREFYIILFYFILLQMGEPLYSDPITC